MIKKNGGNNLEDRVVEIILSEQKKEKRIF